MLRRPGSLVALTSLPVRSSVGFHTAHRHKGFQCRTGCCSTHLRAACPPLSHQTYSQRCTTKTRWTRPDVYRPGFQLQRDPWLLEPQCLPSEDYPSGYQTPGRATAKNLSTPSRCCFHQRTGQTAWLRPSDLTMGRLSFPIRDTQTNRPPASHMSRPGAQLEAGSGRCWGCSHTLQPPSSSIPLHLSEPSVSSRRRGGPRGSGRRQRSGRRRQLRLYLSGRAHRSRACRWAGGCPPSSTSTWRRPVV